MLAKHFSSLTLLLISSPQAYSWIIPPLSLLFLFSSIHPAPPHPLFSLFTLSFSRLHHHLSSLNSLLSLALLFLLLQSQGFPTLLQQQQPLQQQQRFVAPTSGAEAGPSTVQCGLPCRSLPSLPTLGEKDM